MALKGFHAFAADVNLLKVPNDVSVPDERVLFLSDILSTAWHANELGQVSEGDKVAIWGAGPGLASLQNACCFFRRHDLGCAGPLSSLEEVALQGSRVTLCSGHAGREASADQRR